MEQRPFNPSSRSLLTPRDLPRFSGSTLFDAVGRALCEADCLPRKELYESWELARRVRRRMRGGRVVDLAAGHALVAYLMLLLDDTSPSAVAVDPNVPESRVRIARALERAWPRLEGRVTSLPVEMAGLVAEPSDVVISAHACGELTDQALDVALVARARVAVLPCCHDASRSEAGGLEGWCDAALAIDVTRAARMRSHGYQVYTQQIPARITPKNRLLIAIPNEPCVKCANPA